MALKYPTYPCIILEILSSIIVDNVQGGGKLKFHLFNDNYEWSLEDFNICYDLPRDGAYIILPAFENSSLWEQIGGQSCFNSHVSNGSSIINPIF